MKLSPSLLSADFGALREEAQRVEEVAHSFHIDVMDGHFVPNLTIGPPVVNRFRKGISRPLDIHLMIDRPAVFGPQFAVTSEDSLIYHLEANEDPDAVLAALRATGARVGISLCPATDLALLLPLLDHIDLVLVMGVEPGFGGQGFLPAALERIAALRSEIGGRGVEIAVDGGINRENIRSVVDAGADIIVAGSALFAAEDPLE
ncbi:MAG: ribulose-phosphate 3-epimerase, partial [Candidatus Bipolaricaulota bacterium]